MEEWRGQAAGPRLSHKLLFVVWPAILALLPVRKYSCLRWVLSLKHHRAGFALSAQLKGPRGFPPRGPGPPPAGGGAGGRAGGAYGIRNTELFLLADVSSQIELSFIFKNLSLYRINTKVLII